MSVTDRTLLVDQAELLLDGAAGAQALSHRPAATSSTMYLLRRDSSIIF